MSMLQEVLAKIDAGTVQKEDFDALISERKSSIAEWVDTDKCPECPRCHSSNTHHARAVDKTKKHGEPGFFCNAVCYECDNGFCDDEYGKQINETTPEAVRDRIRRRTTENSTDSHLDHEGHQPLGGQNMVDRVIPRRKPTHQQNHGRARTAHRRSTQTQRQRAIGEAIQFVIQNHGKQISESQLVTIDGEVLASVLSKLMADTRFNRDWLYSLSKMVDKCQISNP